MNYKRSLDGHTRAGNTLQSLHSETVGLSTYVYVYAMLTLRVMHRLNKVLMCRASVCLCVRKPQCHTTERDYIWPGRIRFKRIEERRELGADKGDRIL